MNDTQMKRRLIVRLTADLLLEKAGKRDVVIDANDEVSFIFWYDSFILAPNKEGEMEEFVIGDYLVRGSGVTYGVHKNQMTEV